VVGGFWITRRTLAPLDDVARVATELGAERLDRRIELPPHAAVELHQLAEVLNGMLARLDRSVSSMRHFTADASHELRTPLSVLRGELEVTLRRPRSAGELRSSIETALGEVERLSELVEALLTLARSDSGELPLELGAIDVAEVVRRVHSSYEVVATERQLKLTWRADLPVDVESDPTWIERVVANLVDNACKFTPAGGAVHIDVTATPANDGVRITISDTGPGFAPDETEHLFERFYRSRRTRGEVDGFGLGLSLSRDIVRSLGGSLIAQTGEKGGAVFVVELPARRLLS
jgi:two-component system OmpR family sensor kinase